MGKEASCRLLILHGGKCQVKLGRDIVRATHRRASPLLPTALAMPMLVGVTGVEMQC